MKAIRIRPRRAAAALSRRVRLAAVAAVTTLIVLSGATASWALWSATAALSSTASGATVGVTHALSGSTLAATYNGSTTIAVGTVRITNSGSRSGNYTLALSATSASSTLRSAVAVEVGTAASCTTTATLSGAVTGTFAASVAKTGTLAAGAFIDLCVRTSMTASAVSANAGGSLAATASTSISVGTWSATASPAITFSQSVAAATFSVSSSAWYWLSPTPNTALCIEGKNFGSSTGTDVVQETCTKPTGTAANELFRFQATTNGYYRLVYKAAPTLAIGVDNPGNNRTVRLYPDTGVLMEWQVVVNADSTITLQNRNNTGRCLTVPGGSTAAGATMELQSCVTGSATQKFSLTMFQTATPAPIALTCSADGYNAYYSWPGLTGYEAEVVYRVFIGGILVNPHSRGTGWDPTVQFGNGSITTAVYGSGSKSVLVEQNVSNAGWTTTGTGTLVLASSAPFLLCG
jgi:hypothetical protein